MTNRLILESSPYLRLHADDPVDWYPWGDEALLMARSERRPIFLSIGYSACHWCHVMARESFQSEKIATILNTHFVSVKVDREERPDLDSIYMAAVQALTGGGGWPMSVFLTPEGAPFFAGTYFPASPRQGLPSFAQVLQAVAEAWHTQEKDLLDGGERLVAAMQQQATRTDEFLPEGLHPSTLNKAFDQIRLTFDREHGGWGSPHKFPQPMVLEFLLRFHCLTSDATALLMTTQTLETMARSALYDQLGGGFHRYCVDDHWTVPHFEKMLHDNAQLARVYLHAFQVTGEGYFRAVAEETLDYVAREMMDSRGGFFSSQDADSEGQEGSFYLWSSEEIDHLLGRDSGRFLSAYGLTRQGNFEGRNTLRFTAPLADRALFAPARNRLLEARKLRVHPTRDEKVLTSWNGLMLATFSEAARVLHRSDYLEIAERNAGFLLAELRSGNRFLHTWRDGKGKQNGFLEDYACLLDGLIELYQTTFKPHLCLAARQIADRMTTLFSAPRGGFYDTSHDHETLIVRPRDLQDNATPSGNAMAAGALLRLGGLAADEQYMDLALSAIIPLQSAAAHFPLGFAQWLQAMCYAAAKPHEIAIRGDPGDDRVRALLAVVRSGYRPFQVVAVGRSPDSVDAVPLLRGRGYVSDQAAAYVCSGSVCQAPVLEPAALQSLLCRRTVSVDSSSPPGGTEGQTGC